MMTVPKNGSAARRWWLSALLLSALLCSAGRAHAQVGCQNAPVIVDPTLACTVDADFADPVIAAKAASLSGDLDLILAFVRDEIRFEAYTGSLRGARGTLWSGAGNALDKANLAVALLRSSGIRARYVRGTLSPAQSAELVASIFPVVTRVVGCPLPGTPRSDPASDPALLAEVADHFWIEADRSGVFEAVDLSMPGAPASGDVGTRSEVFASVPEALRHHVTLRLVIEMSGTGLANGRRTFNVLEERFAAAELVGRPATFGHYHVESVSGGLFGPGILTYQPFLLIDGEMSGQEAVMLPGDEYQEAHLGLMNEFVTLLEAQFDLEFPGGAVETHQRAIFDRLGPEVREGFLTTSIDIPSGLEPSVTDFDQLTVNVLPGIQALEPIVAQEARVTPVSDEYTALLPVLTEIEENGADSPEDELALRRGNELAAEVVRLASQTLVMSMASASDLVMRALDPGMLTRAYFDSPRLIVALTHYSDEGVRLKLDLRRTSVRAIPYPDQVADQEGTFNFVRGLIDSSIETELMASVAEGAVHSAAAMLEALPDGIGLTDIGPDEGWKLDALAISGNAKALIRAALAAGHSVLVPDAMIPFDGGSHIAWFQIDGETGYAIGVTEDGGHQSAIDYAMLVNRITEQGVLVPAFSHGFMGGIVGFLGAFIGEINNGRSFEQAVSLAKNKVKILSKTLPLMFKGKAKTGLKAGFAAAIWWINHATGADPAVQPFLAMPFDDVVEPPVSGGPVDVEVRLDEDYYVEIDEAQLPTVYRSAIRNGAATAETIEVEFETDAPGFTVVASAPRLELQPGEVGEVGVCLFPIAGLPGVGTLGTVSVDATAPGGSDGDSTDVIAPEVQGITVQVVPAEVSGAPGTSVDFDLIVTSTGNVGETAPTSIDAPAGWIVSGIPASLTLAQGEEQHVAGSVLIPAGAEIGDTASIALGADPCGSIPPEDCTLDDPSERTATLVVHARSAAVSAIAGSGICAEVNDQEPLALAIDAVADAAAAFEADATDASCLALRQRTAALCPLLARLSALADVEDTLCPVALAAPCDGSTVSSLQTTLAPLCDALDYRIEATLVPTATYGAPGADVASVLRLRSRGSQSVTVDVAAALVAPGLDVEGVPAQVVLAPGETEDVSLTLSAAGTGNFAFTLSATPQASPQSEVRARGVHTSTDSVLSVLQVGGVPPFIFVNGTTQIHASVANVISSPVTAHARVTIRRPDTTVQYESPSPVLVTIPGGGTIDLALDFITATGWDEALYTIELDLTTTGGAAIAGGHGEGQLPVGQPLRASVSADPILVPPGTSEVTHTITVESAVDGIGGAGSVPPTDPTLNRINWAAASRGTGITSPDRESNSPFTILIDELGSDSGSYVGNWWLAGDKFLFDLGQSRTFDSIQFRLWDGDERFYNYLIETSDDDITYTPLIDATTGEPRGRQRHFFSPITARYVRIGGTNASQGAGFHLIEEFLVIGDEPTTAEATVFVDVDGVADGGSTFTVGQSVALNAGTYVVTHVGGSISGWPNDTDNGGETWLVNLRVDVPVANKSYVIGHVHNALSLYATDVEAETANLGRAFKFTMPVDGVAWFWHVDGAPGDNRGSEQFEVRQVSGPDDSMTARMRDAIMRGALWEQPAIAAWQNWVGESEYGCMGCHEQTQASVGLEVSRAKVFDTPVDERLHRAFLEGYKTWQDAAGWVSPRHGGAMPITQTSLWAWAVSHFRGSDSDETAAPLLRALDYLVGTQGVDGGWIADNDDGNAAKLYYDGIPSATHTAGDIQALARGVELAQGTDLVPFGDVTISGNRVLWELNPGLNVDVLITPQESVTGVRLSIADTFFADTNFVLGEVEFFDGDDEIAVMSAVADFEQGGYPVSESIDGIKDDTNNGWAHYPVAVSSAAPARAVWIFTAPSRVDRIRIHQPYRLGGERGRGHQIEDLRVDVTTAAAPTLASSFDAVVVEETGLPTDGKADAYVETIRDAARLLASAGWSYTRNTRTAAQTAIGLRAALPFLEGADITDAETRLADVDAWLRSTQLVDGGWNDGAGGVSRVFQSAQALEALVESSESTVDADIIEGAEFLLLTQRADGRWLSPPLATDTPGATTWVQIALPALFENLSGLTLDVSHLVATTDNPVVEGSIEPDAAARIVTAGQEEVQWDSLLVGSDNVRTFELRSLVTGILPGQTRQISNGSTVDFDSLAGSGQLELPPLLVAARHVITIAPGSVTEAPGGVADYVVSIENVRATEDSFELSIDGIDPALVSLPSPVIVPAGATVDVPLQIEVPLDSPEVDVEFRVQGVSAQGTSDSAGALLLVRGDAPAVDPDPVRAVHVELVPADMAVGRGMTATTVVRITNLGDAPDTFDLSGTFPAGITHSFLLTSVLVQPGLGNAREVPLDLSAPDDATPANNLPLTVRATSSTDALVFDDAAGTLDVLGLGVQVTLTPTSGPTGSTFMMHVRNTGVATDGFDLALSGPLAGDPDPVAVLAQASVPALAAGAEVQIEVNVAVASFAVSGSLPLTAIATSTTDAQISDEDTVIVEVPSSRGIDLAFVSDCEEPSGGPNGTAFALQILNLGNVEEEFDLAVVDTTGDVGAQFVHPDGSLVTTLTGIRLPGLAGALASLRALGTNGTFTVAVQEDPGISETATGRVDCSVVTTTTTTSTTSTTLEPLACAYDAERAIIAKKETQISASLGVNGERGKLKFGKSAEMTGDVTATADRMKAAKGVELVNVEANATKFAPNVVVSGTQTTADLPIADPFCPIVPVECGRTDVIIRTGSEILVPGDYGDLDLGRDTSVTLQAGEYRFCSINGSKGSSIELSDSGVIVRVSGGVKMASDTEIGDATHMMQLEVAGSPLKFGSNAQVHASMTAPAAKLVLGKDSAMFGNACSLKMVVGARSEARCQ